MMSCSCLLRPHSFELLTVNTDGVRDIVVGYHSSSAGSGMGAVAILMMNTDGTVAGALNIDYFSMNSLGFSLSNSDQFGPIQTNSELNGMDKDLNRAIAGG